MSKQQAWLLIDDDDAFLQVLQRSLGRQGIEAQLAHGHQEAKTALLEGTFHRCVLDLNLAGESGLQLLPVRLRREEIGRDAPLDPLRDGHPAAAAL